MDKEEGFTLVELLAVIVILGIILAIAIPSVGNVVNKARSNANDAEQQLAVDAGRLYFIAEEPVGEDGKPVDEIPVQDLINKGYLEPRGKEETVEKLVKKHGEAKVTRTANDSAATTTNKSYTYKYVE